MRKTHQQSDRSVVLLLASLRFPMMRLVGDFPAGPPRRFAAARREFRMTTVRELCSAQPPLASSAAL